MNERATSSAVDISKFLRQSDSNNTYAGVAPKHDMQNMIGWNVNTPGAYDLDLNHSELKDKAVSGDMNGLSGSLKITLGHTLCDHGDTILSKGQLIMKNTVA